MSHYPGMWVWVEATDPQGAFVAWCYRSLQTIEREAANEAFAAFANAENNGYRIRTAHVFRESPATYWPRSQPRLVADTKP